MAALCAAVVASGASLARAEHASVTLSYSGVNAANTCPDEATFRGLVAARLGYDPFTGASTRALAVEFERHASEVVGQLSLSGADHEERTHRTLRASAEECFELATSMALVAAVAVDPDATEGRAPSPAPSATEPPAAPPVRPPASPPVRVSAPAAPRAAVSRRSVRLELGALLPVGVMPALRGGVRAGAGLGFGAWSLGAEGAFLFPGWRESGAGHGEVSAFMLTGSLAPCVAPFDAATIGLDLCAVGALGALRSTARHVSRAAPSSDLHATLGPRVALILMLSRAVGLGVSADVPVTLSRVHLHIEESGQRREVWAEPPVAFIGAVSVVARLK